MSQQRGPWIKMGKACEIAGVCRDTMRAWCRTGVVQAVLIPAGSRKDWRILATSLPTLTPQETDPKVIALLRRAGL